MGLISPGGDNLLDFLDLRQVLSTYDGDHRDPLWWPQERPVPMRDARGPLRFPLPSIPGPNLVWSRCRNLRIPLHCETDLGVILESPQGTQSSSRLGACTCAFLPRWSSIVMLPVEWIKESVAFPRGFSARLSHEAFPQGCPTCQRGVSRSSS